MSSVTELRRTPLHLAEASGAPRARLLSGARPPADGPGTVIALRPEGENDTKTNTDTGTGTVLTGHPLADPRLEARSLTRRPEPLASTTMESELSRRISGIARSVAQGALEVLGGSRPLQQMARWLDPESYERLHLRANLVRCITSAPTLRRGGEPASTHRQVIIRSARICQVSTTVFEASVVAFDQKRVRAVALRIEQRRGAWRVTALEIG